jgi:hypothetical protein
MLLYMKYLVCLPFLIISCSSNKYTPSDYPRDQLIHGSGGGFSGAVDSYYLLSNGRLYHRNSLVGELTHIRRVKKRTVKELMSNAKALQNMKFNKPANVYHFIEWHRPADSLRWVWDPQDPGVPEDLLNLYGRLNDLFKSSK